MYKPKEYWEKRLSNDFSLKGVGRRRFSEAYNKYLYKLKRRALERAISHYKIKIQGKSVLDIGSGTGFLVEYYGRLGARVVGIDISKISVKSLMERFPEHSFFRLDIGGEEISIKGKFDIVNVFDVIYHIILDKAFFKAIENIAVATKKGGYIFITDSLSPKRMHPEHVKFRSLEEYEKVFRIVGIEILKVLAVYHFMNRDFIIWSRLKAKIVELLAPCLYLLDTIYLPFEKSNMKLIVCKKT